MNDKKIEADVLVLGGGPGGYAAAFRAADLGKKVVLVEQRATLGGVCLNVGCIPSKALLHAAKVIEEAREMADHGVEFGKLKINLKKLVAWKESIVKQLTGGLDMLAKRRKVTVLQGYGRFTGAHELCVEGQEGQTTVHFEYAIIAAGSEPVKLPFVPEDPRVMDSTGALELKEVPKKFLVIGGGIIGLEMATVYHSLGSEVTIVEFMDQLVPGADADLMRAYYKFIDKRYHKIMLETKVTAVEAKKDGLWVSFEGKQAPAKPERFDRILVAVGRRPNGALIDAEKAGVNVDKRGFIRVDNQLRTNVSHIFAIGDINGNPMLAHKASHEAHVAAEVAVGKKHYFDAKGIPSVAYTDPEIAWVGLTEREAKEQNIEYGKGVFPWMACGRSLGMCRSEGMTKLLFDKKTGRILGAGILGTNAGDLISEVTLAIEMGCDAEDLGLTIHPHPTLSETVMLAAEVYSGTVTDL